MACSVHRSANDGTLFDGAEFVSEISSLENARAWSYVYFDWDPRPPVAWAPELTFLLVAQSIQ